MFNSGRGSLGCSFKEKNIAPGRSDSEPADTKERHSLSSHPFPSHPLLSRRRDASRAEWVLSFRDSIFTFKHSLIQLVLHTGSNTALQHGYGTSSYRTSCTPSLRVEDHYSSSAWHARPHRTSSYRITSSASHSTSSHRITSSVPRHLSILLRTRALLIVPHAHALKHLELYSRTVPQQSRASRSSHPDYRPAPTRLSYSCGQSIDSDITVFPPGFFPSSVPSLASGVLETIIFITFQSSPIRPCL